MNCTKATSLKIINQELKLPLGETAQFIGILVGMVAWTKQVWKQNR